MSYSKISSIILWVVAGFSLVVMIFFFVAENTQLAEDLETRVLELQNGGTTTEVADTPAVDSTVVDSLSSDSLVTDSTATAAPEEMAAPEEPAVAMQEIDLKDHLSGWELMVYKRTDYALVWAYILFIIAAIAAVVFPMINIASDVKALIRLAAVLGGSAVLILLSYFAFASDQTIEITGYIGTENSNPSILKWIGTGLFVTYIAFGMAILSILYSEVVKIFK